MNAFSHVLKFRASPTEYKNNTDKKSLSRFGFDFDYLVFRRRIRKIICIFLSRGGKCENQNARRDQNQ